MKLHLEAEVEETLDIAIPDPFAPPSPATSNGESPHALITMSLTINFSGEQEIDIPGTKALGLPSGKATFGIRRCELRFTLWGCQLPLDKVTLTAPLKRSVTMETQLEQTVESQVGATLGGTVGEKSSGMGSGTIGFKQSGKTVEKVTTERWQIHHTGDESCPMWVFEVQGGVIILQGSLTREKLGTVLTNNSLEQMEVFSHQLEDLLEQRSGVLKNEVRSFFLNQGMVEQTTFGMRVITFPAGNNSFLAAILTARPEDIRLTWGKVGWTPNITRNKLALIERAIALKHIGPQIRDGLSKTEWHYG